LNIREAYEASLLREGHVRDPAQEQIVDLCADLQGRLQATNSISAALRRLFSRRPRESSGEPGLYIWGGVGRGKTFLMDLFFETTAITAKRRIHFHRMMHDVHRRLIELDAIEDPLDQIASDIAGETRLLCFDEFFVSDIGDAMLLGRLLDGLFRRGVTLVTTSNSPPDELYRNGLQRQRFVPAIELLQRFTHVAEIDGGIDYRLRLLQQAGTYLTPDDDQAAAKLQHFFDESASSQLAEHHPLDINGRNILALKCAKGIVWFDFDEICDGPRSQLDYIEIARWYPSVIISGIPILDQEHENQARRFVALVDEFYDRRVKLIISAAADVSSLYTGHKLSFEFDRTASRLIEMQSTEYLASAHLA
jgi:cell division protein ZapE